MKRYILFLVLLLVVTLGAETLTLRPSGQTAISGVFTNGSWASIDEETLDTNDYLMDVEGFGGSPASARFSLTNHTSESGTINSVKVYAYSLGDQGFSGSHFYCDLYISSTRYEGCLYSGTEWSAEWCNHTWMENPNTSTQWTWEDIDDLEVYIYLSGAFSGQDAKVYMMYVEVDYTPSSTPTLPFKINNISNVGKINNIETANIKSYMGVSLQ
jgi:hypothetical protein